MKKKLSIILLTVFTLIMAHSQKIVLKVATVAPPRSPWDIELKKLSQEWNKITKGQVSIKFYDMTVLGGEKGGIQRMRSSRAGQRPQIDGAILTPVGLNELAPKARIFTLASPFLIQNQKELDIVLDKYGHVFEDQIQKAGCKLLTWSNVGWLTFYTKDNYSSLRELKEKKIVVANDTKDFTDVLKLCGFNVDPVPPAKFNQSLKSSNGARGFSAVHLLTYATGLYKDISYALDTRLCPVMAGFVIAEESWALVPDKYKPEMLQVLEKMRKNLNDSLEKMDEDCLNKMTGAGLKMIRLSSTQKSQWDAEFRRDMDNVNRALPTIINMDIYKKISDMLESYRK